MTDVETHKPCRYSGLAIVDRTIPNGPFLGRCECGAVLVIERGTFPWHAPGVGVDFAAWLAAHDAEAKRSMMARVKELHDGFGPSNVAENDYNAGGHEAIGRALDLFRGSGEDR